MSAPPVINVDQIPPGEGLPLDLTLDRVWLAGVLEGTEVTLAPTGKARARVRLDLDGRDVIVSGDLALRVAAECVACLSPVELDLAAEFQEAVVDVLVAKAVAAARRERAERLVVAGGVGANARLRARLGEAAREASLDVFYPALEFCTDNGAMIAFAGAMRLQAGALPGAFGVRARWDLDSLAAPDQGLVTVRD